jgi:hypothetical protein
VSRLESLGGGGDAESDHQRTNWILSGGRYDGEIRAYERYAEYLNIRLAGIAALAPSPLHTPPGFRIARISTSASPDGAIVGVGVQGCSHSQRKEVEYREQHASSVRMAASQGRALMLDADRITVSQLPSGRRYAASLRAPVPCRLEKSTCFMSPCVPPSLPSISLSLSVSLSLSLALALSDCKHYCGCKFPRCTTKS